MFLLELEVSSSALRYKTDHPPQHTHSETHNTLRRSTIELTLQNRTDSPTKRQNEQRKKQNRQQQRIQKKKDHQKEQHRNWTSILVWVVSSMIALASAFFDSCGISVNLCGISLNLCSFVFACISRSFRSSWGASWCSAKSLSWLLDFLSLVKTPLWMENVSSVGTQSWTLGSLWWR